MRGVLIAAMVSLLLSLTGTPAVIRFFRRQGWGQEIRDDGPQHHATKRGTPTMGGAVILVATLIGYGVAHLVTRRGFTATGLLVLMVMTGLGLVGFADDLIKVRNQRNLGLNKTTKLVGQLAVAVAFGVLATRFTNGQHLAPASTHVSFIRDSELSVGAVGFVIWAYLVISASSNAVNLTDGLDGLAVGSAVMVFGAYVIISFWMFGNSCATQEVFHSGSHAACYAVRDPLDVSLIAASAMGACFGFLWWNANPAKIIMGDTGSLAIGGAFAAIAMTTRTELLLVVLGGLFVVETLSVILQIISFRGFHRRMFAMAPVHHHFELAGWPEMTVVVRFWIVTGLGVAFGLGAFYAEYLSHGPLR